MRKGIHPLKFEANTQKLVHALHRIIMPIYIPEESDYFEDAFGIYVEKFH